MLRGTFQIIDLSVDFIDDPRSEPWPPRFEIQDHRSSAIKRAKDLSLEPHDFPDALHLLTETVHTITHVGTHMDAPWHCGPTSGGKPARKIGDVPLEWCIGPGVRLDLRFKLAGELITIADLQRALAEIDYQLCEGDIVLLWTGADQYLGSNSYFSAQPGMGEEAALWLVEQGIKVMGIDAYGLDREFSIMAEAYRKGDKRALWPAHYACRKREFCHIEKLRGLGQLPFPHGFYVIALPIKIPNAGAAWTRVVALVRNR